MDSLYPARMLVHNKKEEKKESDSSKFQQYRDNAPLPELPQSTPFYEFIRPGSFEPLPYIPSPPNATVGQIIQLWKISSNATSSSSKGDPTNKPISPPPNPKKYIALEELKLSGEIEGAWVFSGEEDPNAIDNPKTEAELLKF